MRGVSDIYIAQAVVCPVIRFVEAVGVEKLEAAIDRRRVGVFCKHRAN